MRLSPPANPPKHQLIKLGAWPLNSGSQAEFEAFAALIAPRKLDSLTYFRGAGETITQAGDAAKLTALGASNIMVTYDPKANMQGTANTGTFGNIASGVLDTFYKADAEAAAAAGHTIIARMGHEFNLEGAAVHSYGYPHETAAEFIEGWQHIVNIFKEKGASNVKWCWNPNVWGNPSDKTANPTTWYPGDAYVDYMGLDSYCRHDAPVSTPYQMTESSYNSCAGLGAKPIIICEFGVAKDERFSKAQRIGEFFAMFRDKMPRLVQASHYDQTFSGGGEMSIQSEALATETFKNAVNAPPFVA